jgi:hypothetical protein
MDDARPPFTTTGQIRPAGDQYIEQSVIPVTRSRVYHESCGLVEHEQGLVLKDNLDSRVVWPKNQRASRPLIRDADLNQVSKYEGARCAGSLTVHQNRSRRDEPGSLSAREGELIGEEAIQTLG